MSPMTGANQICANCGGEYYVQRCRLGKRRFCSIECMRVAAPTKKHGLCYSIEHRNWRNMIDRCGNPKHQYYHRYGGRGITVCERWLGPDGFANFYADMGAKPTPQHSLDRINNHLGYSPENCKWATKREQAQNRKGCWTPQEDEELRRIHATGLNFGEISRLLGKPVRAAAYRLGLKTNFNPHGSRKVAPHV